MTAVIRLKSGFEIAVSNLKEIIVSHGDKETKYTNFNDFFLLSSAISIRFIGDISVSTLMNEVEVVYYGNY